MGQYDDTRNYDEWSLILNSKGLRDQSTLNPDQSHKANNVQQSRPLRGLSSGL